MTDGPLPASGWYPDPDGPAGERYWNGSTWTDERRVAGPPPPPGMAPRSGGHNSSAITALVLSILGLVACQVLSPVGMILGRNELRRVDSGVGDQSARGMANAAYIVGTAILVLAAVLLIIILIAVAASPR
ncbi:MAG: DUF2510 domain-containing protein [Acidimicrobiales bacterium]|nr:DUF2510 domain-containing protein [Acidimicrobiales bacterium]